VKLYVGGRPTFFYVLLTFFSDFKNMTFYVFLSCCTRFLEHWSAITVFGGGGRCRGDKCQIIGGVSAYACAETRD